MMHTFRTSIMKEDEVEVEKEIKAEMMVEESGHRKGGRCSTCHKSTRRDAGVAFDTGDCNCALLDRILELLEACVERDGSSSPSSLTKEALEAHANGRRTRGHRRNASNGSNVSMASAMSEELVEDVEVESVFGDWSAKKENSLCEEEADDEEPWENELSAKFNLESNTCASIGVEPYMARIRKYSDISDTCYVVAMIYLGRLQSSGRVRVSRTNVHKLLLMSVLLATKFCEDQRYSNKMWSAIGGISLKHINELEFAYLELIEFNFDVTEEELRFAVSELVE